MATAHVWPFDTVKSGRSYDSDPHYKSPVTAPGAVTTDKRRPDLDGRFEVYEEPHGLYFVTTEDAPSRYPPPAEAELVTIWKKDRRVVMSVTANGKTQDFYMPPARLVYLLRECAEQLAEHTLIQ